MRNLYTILVRKPEDKRPFGWYGNIYTDSEEMGSNIDWVLLSENIEHCGVILNTAVVFRVP
jgi:hypothetical protein